MLEIDLCPHVMCEQIHLRLQTDLLSGEDVVEELEKLEPQLLNMKFVMVKNFQSKPKNTLLKDVKERLLYCNIFVMRKFGEKSNLSYHFVFR